ncbi:MAG: hypothetical protein ABW249_09330, partial [Solirubrobacterales bacterium]
DCTIALGLWEVDDAAERLREQWSAELVEAVAGLYDLALVYGPSAGDDVRIERLRGAGVPVHNTRRVGMSPANDGPGDSATDICSRRPEAAPTAFRCSKRWSPRSGVGRSRSLRSW